MSGIGAGTIGSGTIGDPAGTGPALIVTASSVPFIPTELARVAEPTITYDTAGDEVETFSTRATGVLCHQTEKAHRAFVQSEGRWTTVRQPRILLAPGCPLGKGWRVTLLGSGHVFTVTHVFEDDATLLGQVVRADLERITG